MILLWLRKPPTGCAASATANKTADLVAPQVHRHPRLPNIPHPDAAEMVDYPIPGTTTVIHFILGPALPPAVMSVTIVSAYNHIVSTIASQGDGFLPASEDPFMYDRGCGAFIEARSAGGRHLTWSSLEGAVLGLYNGLYLRGRFRASEFWIWNGPAGLLGAGKMGAAADVVGGGGRNGTVGGRGVAGVGKGSWNGNGTASGSVESLSG